MVYNPVTGLVGLPNDLNGFMNGSHPNYMILQGRSPSSILKTTMVMLVVDPTHLKKYASQTWESSPIFGGEIKTCSKPPPRWFILVDVDV